MYPYKKLRCLVKEKVHSSIHSTLNTTFYIRMAGECVLAFLCKCIQSNKKWLPQGLTLVEEIGW